MLLNIEQERTVVALVKHVLAGQPNDRSCNGHDSFGGKDYFVARIEPMVKHDPLIKIETLDWTLWFYAPKKFPNVPRALPNSDRIHLREIELEGDPAKFESDLTYVRMSL